MDHDEERAVLGQAECNPAFLIVAAMLVIINRNRQRIPEQRRGLLEADGMLLAVRDRLGRVPGEVILRAHPPAARRSIRIVVAVTASRLTRLAAGRCLASR
jgi:hypothetical protein